MCIFLVIQIVTALSIQTESISKIDQTQSNASYSSEYDNSVSNHNDSQRHLLNKSASNFQSNSHTIVNKSDSEHEMNKVQNGNKLPISSSSAITPTTTETMLPYANSKVFSKTDYRKRKTKSVVIDQIADWKCPNITENSRYLECGCDIPYTLRCSGDLHGLEQIAKGLRSTKYSVSLLDCTLKNVTFLSDARIFDNVSLHGLVISSGEIKRVHRRAFFGMKIPLQALGLPNNALSSVPWQSLSALNSLCRLDLSSNQIKYLGASDFLVSILIKIIFSSISV